MKRLSYADAHAKVAKDIEKIKGSFLELLLPVTSDAWERQFITEPVRLYKVVAAVDGKMLSIWDGQTSYHLGKRHLAKCGASAWPPLFSCYFAFESPEKAINARFPSSSKLSDAPRVLIEIEALGRSYHHKLGDGMWAISDFKMVSILS